MMGFGCDGIGFGHVMGWGGGMLGWIVPLLFLGLLLIALVIGIVWLVRQLSRKSSSGAPTETPLEASRRRLALGEITLDEFDEIARRLRTETAVVDR